MIPSTDRWNEAKMVLDVRWLRVAEDTYNQETI